MHIEKVLSELGLTKNKGLVYLAALALGTGSVEDVARKANLPRTTVHEILKDLAAMGLISFVCKGRARMYIAEHPEKLLTLVKEKERHLQTVLPELSSLFRSTASWPQVHFYEGVQGTKVVLNDTLKVKNKMIYMIISMKNLFEIPGKDYMEDYVKRRIEADIYAKIIRSEINDILGLWPTSHSGKREVHYAPPNMLFPMSMVLYDNKVAVIGTRKESFGMIIKSEDFYNTFKNLFEVIWQVTRVCPRSD